MKKTIFAAALALAASASFAQVTGFVKYDYDNADGKPWKSQHEGVVGAATATKLGTFDAGVVVRRQYTNVIDDVAGVEVGYSQGLKVGAVKFTGRAAVAQLFKVDNGARANNSYYTLGVDAMVPMRAQGDVSLFAGYRFRNGFDGDTQASNRWTGGVQFAASPKADLRLGFSTGRIDGRTASGVTTSVAYKF